MTERKKPSGFGRGMAVLAIVALGAMAVTPAFSAFTATKGKIKKIATKQATKVVDASTIGQGLVPAVTASITDPDKPVFTRGPFTVTLDCSDDGGDVNLRLLVTTSENDSVVDSGSGSGYGELNAGDPAFEIHDHTGNAPGGDASIPGGGSYYAQTTLRSPSGTGVYVAFNPITNFVGHHCFVEGLFLNMVE